MIFNSSSNSTPVFKKTCFLTFSIKISISADVALPLLIKKLLCLDEILAPPMLRPEQLEDSINSQAFLFCGFLNVLPQVLTLVGWLFFFLFNQIILFLLDQIFNTSFSLKSCA